MPLGKIDFRHAALGFLTATILAGVPVAEAADEPDNVIKYRKNVMQAQAAHISNIVAVLKGEVSFTKDVAPNARALNATSLMILEAFPKGTDQGDTRAKPAIWQDWAKFETVTNNFIAATEELEKAAESGDMAAVGAKIQAVGKGCGNCHDTFRKEKK